MANKPLMILIAILSTRVITTGNKPTRQVLVQWSMSTPEDATWEDFDTFCQVYKMFNLKDKVVFGEGSNDSPAHYASPITLDLNEASESIRSWLESLEHGNEPLIQLENAKEEAEKRNEDREGEETSRLARARRE